MIRKYSTDINVLIEDFILKDNSWKKLSKESYDLAYKPFCYYGDKEFLIDSLDFTFAVEGRVTLRKEILEEGKKKHVNKFNLCWGFYYDKFDKEEDSNKYFYIEMSGDRTWDNAILSKAEYEDIAVKIKSSIDCIKDTYYDIEDPDDNDLEYFLVWLDFEYYKELNKFFKICKEELIEKFVSKLKD